MWFSRFLSLFVEFIKFLKMNRLILVLTVLCLLGWGCRKDGRERLFEMAYPSFNIEIPAGIAPTQALDFPFYDINTNIDFFLNQSQTDTSAIYAINPYFARLTSLDNLTYYFIEQVSVRICPNTGAACSYADEVFYIDDLRGRGDGRLDLLPTLRNVKPLLTGKKYRMDVVFFLNDYTPYSISGRFDMSFEAVR